jgi:hypothetical protein
MKNLRHASVRVLVSTTNSQQTGVHQCVMVLTRMKIPGEFSREQLREPAIINISRHVVL